MRICEVPDCGRKHEAKGLCHKHHMKMWMTGTLERIPKKRRADLDVRFEIQGPSNAAHCAVPGCIKKIQARGLCQAHYYKQLTTGTLRSFRRPKGKGRSMREVHLLRRYSMTSLEYDAMLAAQGGRCAICKAARPNRIRTNLYVDHDHTTGQVRSLLCGSCNYGIGSFADDPKRLRAAADYLETHARRARQNQPAQQPLPISL